MRTRTRRARRSPRAPPSLLALVVVVVVVLATAAPIARVSAEDASCPCLTAITWSLLGIDSGTNAACNRVDVAGEVQCYPATYGLTCAAHDSGLEPYCDAAVASPPAYCAEQWCYVDPALCRASSAGLRFGETQILQDASGLAYYSYATCGGDGSSWDTRELDNLKGKTLRASVPILSYPPDQARLGLTGPHTTAFAW